MPRSTATRGAAHTRSRAIRPAASRPDPQAAIGVFDSGIGGLTVLKALLEVLPRENFIYLGDTARVPYGNKSPATVTRYALENTLFLLQREVKAIVVACNTVSSLSLDQLGLHFRVPVLGVIEPAAAAAVRATRAGTVGVIGTVGTIASGAYERALRRLDPDLKVKTTACPLFVPLVEEGFTEHPIATLTVAEYLAPMKRAQVDALILGCTHYPFLRRSISEYLGEDVQLVDSGPATAIMLKSILQNEGLLSRRREAGTVSYCLSDIQPHFRKLGQRFLGREIPDVSVVSL